jgi:hypothetical protein
MATAVTRSKPWTEGGVSVARVRRAVARKSVRSTRDLALADPLPALDRALLALAAEAKDELRERRMRLKPPARPQRLQ